MDISRSYGETTLPDASAEFLFTAAAITTPLAAAFRPTIGFLAFFGVDFFALVFLALVCLVFDFFGVAFLALVFFVFFVDFLGVVFFDFVFLGVAFLAFVFLAVAFLVLVFFAFDFAFEAFLVTTLRRLRGAFDLIESALLRLTILRIDEVSLMWIFRFLECRDGAEGIMNRVGDYLIMNCAVSDSPIMHNGSA